MLRKKYITLLRKLQGDFSGIGFQENLELQAQSV
jgi:hypothetical protein